MTPKEAKEWLVAIAKKYIHGGDAEYDKKRKKAIKIAIYAIEKQIPKKPEHDNGAWSICPACFGSVPNDTEEAVNHETSYCDHCGQALDWSDTE